MKKIYTIFFLTLLIIGCSTDDNKTIQEQNPEIENVSSSTARVNDIISIEGNNFDPDGDYKILFNGIEGEIIEIAPNQIRVKIPENATSGDITFIYKNDTTIIGNITIENSAENLFKLFSTKDFPGYTNSAPTKFIEINPETGEETSLITFGTNQTVESLIFHEQKNKVIGISSFTDENDRVSNEIVIIDIINNTYTSIQLSDDVYYELSLSNDGKLFAIKDFPGYTNSKPTEFIEIDMENGEETHLLDLETNQFVESLVFDEQNYKVIGVSYIENENDQISTDLISIDITTNNYSSVKLSDNIYYELSLSNDGKLFAIKDFPGYTNSTATKFIEINMENGQETDLLDLETNQMVESLVFDQQNNTVIGVSYKESENGNINNSLFLIDVNDKSSKEINLENDVYYELGYY